MPRSPRIVITNCPHHITQRGNNKIATFIDDEDYSRYLYTFEKYATKYGLLVYSYCLMPNHIHFKVTPRLLFSLAKTFNCTQVSYTFYFNKKYNRIGHLWQGRFFSCPLDTGHCYSVSKYIELNPVRANIVQSPELWKWSSARYHLGQEQKTIRLAPISTLINVSNWKKYLENDLSLEKIKEIRKNTLSGYPLGDTSFIQNIEKLKGISLKKRPVGRPLL